MNDHATTDINQLPDFETRPTTRRRRWATIGLIPLLLAPVGCSTGTESRMETAPSTTTPPETSAPVTSAPDTAASDTAASDTASPDTASPDTSASDNSVPATSIAPAPERLDIVARDFSWSGLPTRLQPGSYPLTLRNEGSEFHEIQIFRNTESLSLDELFDLGPIEWASHVAVAGGVITGPGTTSEPTEIRLDEGTYDVVCFIPAASDQQPHYEHGMHTTIEVG